jgi:tRNA 2-thiouridine synthesizing protein A
MMTTVTTATTLDTRGLNCPLPILRTRKALSAMASGEALLVQSTDPGSVKDIESFCEQTGHELLTTSNDDHEFQFIIRKS